MTTIYGIKTCDTMQKARAWLEARGADFRFHDYRKDGIDAVRLAAWADALGWESLLNRAGTTFLKLPETDRTGLDRQRALSLMLDQPAMIRRPVLEHQGRILVGFKPESWAETFS